MAPKGYPHYTRVIFLVTAQDLGPLRPKKGAKTHSERLQNDFQGLNFPLLSPQNGPKWPQMAPKGYPEYTRVIFWVTAQDLGLFGPQKGAKTDTEGHQSNIQGLNCQNL